VLLDVLNELPTNPDAIHGMWVSAGAYAGGGGGGGGGAAATCGGSGAGSGAGGGGGGGGGGASEIVPAGVTATALSNVRLPHTFGTRKVYV
jgi:hypothetical protein